MAVTVAVACAVVGLGSMVGAPTTAKAQGDPLAVVNALGDAVVAGDAAAVAALFADDGYFEDIDGGPFGAFGRRAIEYNFTGIGDSHPSATSVSSAVSGNTVTGVVEFSNDPIRAAGVTRIVQPFTSEVVDKKIKSFVLTYDENDAQTAAYLAYSAANPGQGPPADDYADVQMAGAQGGTGTTFLAQGMASISIGIAPGPAGVWQPAKLYAGTCDHLGAVVSPLAPVLAGGSYSILSLTYDQLVDSHYVIGVNASADDHTVVSCGSIERRVVEQPTATATAPPAPTATAPAPPATAPAPTATLLPLLGNTGTGGARDDSAALAWLLGIATLGAAGVAGSVAMRRRS